MVVALQGALAVIVGVVLAIRTVTGHEGTAGVGYGMSVLFVVLGVGMGVAGAALARSMRGGRGPAVVVQLVLLPVAWTLLTASGQVLAGILVGAVALAVLALLLSAPSRRWMAEQYDAAVAESAEDP